MELDLNDIQEALLDEDGTLRDVNFDGSNWEGVSRLIGILLKSFNECTATDSEGREGFDLKLESSLEVAQDGGYLHLVFKNGSGFTSHLQVFITREDDGSPFVELTFSPNDVERTQNLATDFLEWANEMRKHLGARRYFARYENASWRIGDTSHGSGVFFVSDEIEPNNPAK